LPPVVTDGQQKAWCPDCDYYDGALEVEMVDNVVIIRGYAPCYYVKQLALQGVFDVLGSFRTSRVELNVYGPEPTMSVADSQ
jgi:hypothetical protein